MVNKALKSAVIQSAQQAQPLNKSRLDAESLRRIAEVASRSLPPAVAARERRSTLVNVKVAASLADALAERAAQDGITQKQMICQALAPYGLPVNPLDLEDRTPRRQRAA